VDLESEINAFIDSFIHFAFHQTSYQRKS